MFDTEKEISDFARRGTFFNIVATFETVYLPCNIRNVDVCLALLLFCCCSMHEALLLAKMFHKPVTHLNLISAMKSTIVLRLLLAMIRKLLDK